MRPNSAARFRAFVLVSIASLVVTACGGAASPSAPAATTPGASAASPSAGGSPEPSAVTGASCQAGATEVKFWTSHTPPDSDTLAKIVDSFNQANPDICVKMTIVPGSETDVAKLTTAIRGGVAPDVYMADRFTVPQRAAEGVLTELPAEAASLKDQYLEMAWDETQFQGKTYALPFDFGARALYYNKDLIKAAGEDPAQLDISKGPLTIDTVVKIADKITTLDSSGNYDVMGWVPGGPGPGGNAGALDQGWHYTWGFVYGGKFADLAACKVTPTDAGVVAGFQFLYDWAKAHDPEKVSRWVSTNLPPNAGAQQNPFVTGKLAMVITGDWRIGEMAKNAPNTDYGITYIPVPKAGDESVTWDGGWSMALIPDSKVPDQAVKFIEYITGPEGQKVYTQETGHLPTLKLLLEDASIYAERSKVFLELAKVATNRPALSVGAIYWDALTSAQGSVELNAKEPQAALQEVQDTVQPRLDEVGC
jgi:multiple sugar transport system substrate-binding protein